MYEPLEDYAQAKVDAARASNKDNDGGSSAKNTLLSTTQRRAGQQTSTNRSTVAFVGVEAH